MVPPANPSPNPERHLDQLSRFCTALGRDSLYFTMGRPFPLKIALHMGDLDPPSNTCDRCFAAAGPGLWNTLPIQLQHCDSIGQFKRLLKTYLFGGWDRGAL